jgi:hypothetical protein
MPRFSRSLFSTLAVVSLVGLPPALSGCSGGSVQEALGMDKRAPDEFAVVSRAPLIVPPDYQLRPPRPGAVRPVVGNTADQARASLTGVGQASVGATTASADGAPISAAAAPEPTTSVGQTALLDRAVTTPADPDIRTRLSRENLALTEVEGELYTRLMKWQQPVALGHTVDAAAESERLLANRVEGKSPTEGDTPVITERRQSPLGGLVETVF